MMVNFKNLTQTENIKILECFNHAFSDYSIPFKLNLTQLESKLYSESINKEISIGAFRNNRLIGFVLHGKRQSGETYTAYNAGTGVRPEERGKKLTRKMYDHIIPKLEASKISEVVLEVISNNIPAIKSYEAVGFHQTRNLTCFNGDIHINKINTEVQVKQIEGTNIEDLDRFGDIRPTWQNSKDTILNLGNNVVYLTAYCDEEICGYCIINTSNNRILQIAVKNNKRNRYIGSSLIHYIKENISESISIINIDSSSKSTLDFFRRRNLRKTLTQKEMKLTITR